MVTSIKHKNHFVYFGILVASGAKDLYFEAVPDFDITTFSARLCSLKVTKVGKNLNCMESRSASVGDPVVSFYNKTSTSREFTDYGAINLGQSCPIATTDQEAEDNKFVANLVFEMPPQTAIEDGNIPRLVSIKLFINMLHV